MGDHDHGRDGARLGARESRGCRRHQRPGRSARTGRRDCRTRTASNRLAKKLVDARTTDRSTPGCRCRRWRNRRSSTARSARRRRRVLREARAGFRGTMSVPPRSTVTGSPAGAIDVRADPAQPSTAMLGDAAVIVWNDVSDEGRSRFYAWHDREHIPERLAIPGFRRGRRYIRPGHSPEWLTLYEASDLAVVTSPAYLRASMRQRPQRAPRCPISATRRARCAGSRRRWARRVAVTC